MNWKQNKIGFSVITLGAIIIIGLLLIFIFVEPKKAELPKTFKGPDSPPSVKGPTELPNGER